MTSPNLLLTSLYSLPLLTLTLAFGSITTSYVLFSCIGESQRGVIPLINGESGTINLSTRERVRAFRLFLPNAGTWIVGSSVLSALLAFTTAYLHPSPLIQRLTLASGLASLAVIPMTPALGILKINSELFSIDREARLTDTSTGSATKTTGVGVGSGVGSGARTGVGCGPVEEDSDIAKRARELLAMWARRHAVRYISYAGAWGLAFIALILDGRA